MTRKFKICDAHCHYDDAWFDEDREELLSSLPENNVELAVSNAVDIKSALRNRSYA